MFSAAIFYPCSQLPHVLFSSVRWSTKSFEPLVLVTISFIAAIFYPFSQFCGIDVSLMGLKETAKGSLRSISEGSRIGQESCQSPGSTSVQRATPCRTALRRALLFSAREKHINCKIA